MPGFLFIEVPADTDGPTLEGGIWYPCAEPAREIDLGKITVAFEITQTGTRDCPVNGDRLPLVVISHGRRSHFVLHHDTAETLADAGFVVAAINHCGDTYFDMSHSDYLSAFVGRPTDIKRLVDFMLGASPVAANIDPQHIGIYGFSRGGYTGLVLIGANPDWSAAADYCRQSSSHWCEQIRRKEFPAPPPLHDPRIRAAAVADPFAVFFTPDSLSPIKVPVQLWASECGGDGVTSDGVAAIHRSLRAKHEYRVVPNSSHFAFLIPCPPVLATTVPEISPDAPGFDRLEFHRQFNADVRAFFRAHLDDTGN